MKDWNRHLACGMAACAALVGTRANAQTPARTLSQYRIAARTGQQAPGMGPGWVFSGFGFPVLDSAGLVAFFAEARLNNTYVAGLWMETPGGLRLVCHDGQSPIGHPELAITLQPTYGRPVRTDVNSVVFEASLSGISTSGVLVGTEAGAEMICFGGMTAPGTTGVFVPPLNTDTLWPGATNDGRVTIGEQWTSGSAVSLGIWVWENGVLSPRLLTGTTLPLQAGTLPVSNVTFSSWAWHAYSQPPSREVFYVGSWPTNGSVWTGRNGGVILGQLGTPSPVPGYSFARIGQTLPAASEGGVLFHATLRTATQPYSGFDAFCAWNGTDMRVVMRSDVDLPGHPPGTRWLVGSMPGDALGTILTDGRVVATPFTTTSNYGLSLMREGPSGMETLARAGMPVPDDPSQLFTNDQYHAQYAANGVGQIAFGDIDSLYVTDESGVLRGVVLPARYAGNQQTSPPTSIGNRPVLFNAIRGYPLSNGHDGRPRWLNDAGQFAISMYLGPPPLLSAILIAQGPHIPGAPRNCNDTDFNNDGLYADVQDITDFIDAMGGAPAGTRVLDSIDFNNDGLFPDTLDIESFLSVASGGPCLY